MAKQADLFVRTEHAELMKKLSEWDIAYHTNDSPVVDDATYDEVKRKAIALETEYPDLVGINQKVGASIKSEFQSFPHTVPMLSLDNVYSDSEANDWLIRVKSNEIFCEPKIDGVSFSARYEDGFLVRGLTRGDGSIGEDITENIRTISDIPKQINFPGVLEIRGEIYMAKKEFLDLNENSAKKFANPRNAAAGSLRQLDANITRTRNLNAFAYTWGEVSEQHWKTQAEFFELLNKLGFKTTSKWSRLCKNGAEISEYTEDLGQIRASLPFDIDGAVYKVNDIIAQKKLGFIAHSPRWATAFKFPAQQGQTTLNGITIQVGRTGILTPVAELEPINLGGVLISRATLHNADEIRRKDFRVGDTVIIQRAADVIPQVVSVVSHSQNSEPFVFPNKCPICGSEVVQDMGLVARRCANGLSCQAQIVGGLAHFVGRKGFDIEGLGERQLEKFVALGWIKGPADIFTLIATHGDELKNMDGFGDKSVANLGKSIESARKIELHKFLFAIGIPEVGETTAKLLARNLGNFEAVRGAKNYELQKIDGIGEVMATEIMEFFADDNTKNALENLLAQIEITQSTVNKTVPASELSGKKVVITGTLPKPREEIKRLLEKLGAVVQSSVSAKTDILLAGQEAGGKLAEAQKLGIKIWSGGDFEKILANFGDLL